MQDMEIHAGMNIKEENNMLLPESGLLVVISKEASIYSFIDDKVNNSARYSIRSYGSYPRSEESKFELFKTDTFKISHSSYEGGVITISIVPIEKTGTVAFVPPIRCSISTDLQSFYENITTELENLVDKFPNAFIVPIDSVNYLPGTRPLKYANLSEMVIYQKDKDSTIYAYPTEDEYKRRKQIFRPAIFATNKESVEFDPVNVVLPPYAIDTLREVFGSSVEAMTYKDKPSDDVIKTGYMYSIGDGKLYINGEVAK